MSGPKRTEPTRSLLKGGVYVNAASTDIRKRFEAIRAAAQAAEPKPAINVRPIQARRKP